MAAIHGPFEFYLHDDFYDDDGVACQPEHEVLDSELWPSVTLDDAKASIDSLIEYATTRWWLTDEVIHALRRFRGEDLLENLKPRYAQKRCWWFHHRFDGIIGKAVGPIAEPFLLDRLTKQDPVQQLSTLSNANSAISTDVALDIGLSALTLVDATKRVPMLCQLGGFRSVRVLDWIDENVHDPLTSEWGDVAACSGLSWLVVKRWIEVGRPHSLIALDALLNCRAPRPSASGLIKEIRPKLIDEPDAAEIREILLCYRAKDASPRVDRLVGQILADLKEILSKK